MIYDEELMKKVIGITAVSGGEHAAATEIAELFREAGCKTHVNQFGAVIAVSKGMTKQSSDCHRGCLLFDSHIDEIGLAVSGYEENGFVRIANVSGVDPKVLPASEVLIHAKNADFTGIIGCKPPHLLTGKEKEEAFTFETLFVDTGLTDSVLRSEISIGDYVTVKPFYRELYNDYAVAKAFDDRAAVYSFILAAREINKTIHEADVWFVCTVQEERPTVIVGQKSVLAETKPDLITVCDVTHATMPGMKDDRLKELGSGIVITEGPTVGKDVTKLYTDICRKRDIPYTKDISVNYTGTNKDSYDKTYCGIPTGVVSLPLRYMHTPNEIICKRDLESLTEFIVGLSYSDNERIRNLKCY